MILVQIYIYRNILGNFEKKKLLLQLKIFSTSRLVQLFGMDAASKGKIVAKACVPT